MQSFDFSYTLLYQYQLLLLFIYLSFLRSQLQFYQIVLTQSSKYTNQAFNYPASYPVDYTVAM